MSYSTGTLNSAVDFVSIFDTFLLANGWTKVNNSAVVTGVSITYAAGSIFSIAHGVNALAAIPLGSKITFTGSGSANIYHVKRSTTTTSIGFSDVSFTTLSAGSATFSWTTYNKGTKYLNFAGGIHSQNSIHYLMLDMYHASTGTHTKLDYVQTCRFDPALTEIPCTYHLFSSSTPDMVTAVFVFGTFTQWFVLGDLVKVHTSAYPGGEFICGSSNVVISSSVTRANAIAETTLQLGTAGAIGLLPFSTVNSSSGQNAGLIHAEIDGVTYVSSETGVARISVVQNCIRKLFRGLNNWNQQTLLVVPELQFTALSNFRSYLGYIEHFRYVRVDNYNVNDSLILGSDTWKIFPVSQKNTVTRNGSSTNTGTLGFAVRYVP